MGKNEKPIVPKLRAYLESFNALPATVFDSIIELIYWYSTCKMIKIFMNMISYADFEKVDIRVGTITEVKDFPQARKPAYQLLIDFGPEIGVKRSSAQITQHYTKEELLGKQVMAVVNFPEKQIASFFSQSLTLGVPDEKGNVVLISPTLPVPNGKKMF